MAEEEKKHGGRQLFRAHVWSPLNDGEAILELDTGTTVKQLLETLSGIWGARFAPEHGFARYGLYIAGWCVLCKDAKGVFCPLGINDTIPSKPPDIKPEDEYRCDRDRYRSWWGQIAKLRQSTQWMTNQFSLMMKEKDPLLSTITADKGVKRKGVMYTGSLGVPRGEQYQVLVSGPQPEEPVDIQLAIIIAVSGT